MHFFFCCSGFMVAYRHWEDERWSGLRVSLSYLRSKLVRIYPLYFICIFIALAAVGSKRFHDLRILWDFICNIFLLQAWGTGAERLQFSINGPTWFLSTLLFCYFIAPLLLTVLRRARTVLWPFAVFFVLMYGIQFLRVKYPGDYFELDLYTNPLFRMLEFGLAMCAYPLFVKVLAWWTLRGTAARRFAVATVAEVMAVVLLAVWIVPNPCGIFHATWALWFLAVILVFSLDAGGVPWLLKRCAFDRLSPLTMELYIAHGAVFRFTFKHLFRPCVWGDAVAASAAVILTFLAAIAYKRWCAARLNALMDSVFCKLSACLLADRSAA